MACKLAPSGVRVNVVSPGSVLTDGTRELFYADAEKARRILSFFPQGRPGETRDIAEAVAFLASDAASCVNGRNLVDDGAGPAASTATSERPGRAYGSRRSTSRQ